MLFRSVVLHHYFINDFSAAAYLISRHHASKIMKNHIRGNKFKLSNGIKPRATSEDTIFGSGITYSIPWGGSLTAPPLVVSAY